MIKVTLATIILAILPWITTTFIYFKFIARINSVESRRSLFIRHAAVLNLPHGYKPIHEWTDGEIAISRKHLSNFGRKLKADVFGRFGYIFCALIVSCVAYYFSENAAEGSTINSATLALATTLYLFSCVQHLRLKLDIARGINFYHGLSPVNSSEIIIPKKSILHKRKHTSLLNADLYFTSSEKNRD